MKLNRKWPFFVLGFFGFCLLLILGLVFFVRSEAGSRQILAFAKEYLAKNQATELSYDEGRIDPFAGLHFKHLKIIRQEPKADIEIDSLDIAYDLSLLRRRVDIVQFQVLNPRIQLHLKPSSPAATPTPAPTPTKAGKSLDDIIHDPPALVTIRNMEIKGLRLDLVQETDSGVAKAKIDGLDFHLSFDMLKDQLKIAGDLNTGNRAEIQQSSSMATLSFSASAQGKWDIDVHHEGSGWIYSVRPSSWQVSLAQLRMESRQAGERTSVVLPALKLDSKMEVSARSRELFKLEANSFEAVSAEEQVLIPSIKIDQSSAKQASEIENQALSFTSNLAGDKIIFDGKYSGRFKVPSVLVKPMNLGMVFSAQSPRDLAVLNAEAKATANEKEFLSLKADLKKVADGVIEVVGKMNLTADERLADTVKAAAILKKTKSFNFAADFSGKREADGRATLNIKSQIPRIIVPGFTKPSAIDFTSSAALDGAVANLNLNAALGLNNEEIGKWKVVTALETTLPPKAIGSKKPPLPPVKGHGRTEIVEVEAPKDQAHSKVPAVFAKPFTIEHSYDLVEQPGSLEIKAEIPAVEMPGTANLKDTRFTLHAKSPNLAAAQDIDVKANLTQGAIELAQPLADQAVRQIAGATLKVAAALRGGADFTLDELKASLDGSTLEVSAKAVGNIKTKNVQATAQLALRIPENFPPLAGSVLRGQLEVPVTLNMVRGQEVTLTGDVGARNLSWKKGALAASGISGHFPFSEKLILDGKHLKFSSLITQNPFERVDFERVRPLLRRSEQLRIDRIQWEEKTYGPFIGFFSLSQNVVYAHQFDMDIGSGRLSGELFFDAYPKNLQFGSLARITNVNLGEVLPKKFLARLPQGDKNISGRSGFVFNLNRGTMDGRVDVTEIGGPQLIALANILDPAYEDEKLNKVRSLLQFGYPTQVQLEFAEGYLNMEIKLYAKGINLTQSVRGIPISSFLSAAMSDIVKETEKGPIK